MAIAFVRATNGGFTVGSTHTFAFDCTSASMLFVTVFGGTGSYDITGVTYNSVACTEVDRKLNTSDRWVAVYKLASPATGSNNVVVSTSGSACGGSAACYSGANGTIDTKTTNGTSSPQTSLTTSLSSTIDQDWFFQGTKDSVGGSGGQTAGTGATLRAYDTSSGIGMFDSGSAQGIGSYSMTTNNGTSRQVACVMCCFDPAGAATGWGPLLDSGRNRLVS